MPSLKLKRQELFAQLVANGLNTDLAYKRAGYKPNRGNAGALRNEQHVLERIEELLLEKSKNVALIEEESLQIAIDQTGIDKTRIIEWLIEDRHAARLKNQFGTAVRAAELIGIELGMFVKQTENRHKIEQKFTDLPPEEQERQWNELLTKAEAIIRKEKLIEGTAETLAIENVEREAE